MTRLYAYIIVLSLIPALAPGQSPWHNQLRTVRYRPEGEDFVITNGTRRFNRALYGTHTAFRVEAGDLPEFALYMPGLGGNLNLGLTHAKSIKAIYRPGSMRYEIRDPALGNATLHLTLLALADAEGLILRLYATGGKPTLHLSFGGVSGKKFSRDGDIGADPESSFDLDPANCRDNKYSITNNTFLLTYNSTKSLEGILPPSAKLSTDNNPILHADLTLTDTSYLLIRNPSTVTNTATPNPQYSQLPSIFAAAESTREQITSRVQLKTPDPWLNTLGGALAIAADAIWEAPSYLHGAIAWRQRLPAWRGPYVADPLGWHDRARQHFSSYALSQITTPAGGPVIADTNLHLARQLEQMGTALFSSGYICRNPNGDIRPHHYDMNLVFIDQLLTHFYWTGDTSYVRQMWPVLTRHLAWEKRNFDADGDGLYDAYCCIWASDALEYGGGGVTHSSAYNYRANKLTADLATLIGEDPTPYRKEAEHILAAINKKLWLAEEDVWAEYIDWTPPAAASCPAAPAPNVHPAPGVWTIYHAIDSHIGDERQNQLALSYIDQEIPHIPIRATGLDDTTLYTIATTNWQPYTWSLNNVALAESLHTALAFWQGHRPEQAFRLWKGSLISSMYLDASPGNFQQLSSYDAARGELYRDFGDPIGMAARSLVEGLFGIEPDALHDTLRITPGWPITWNNASLHIPDIDIDFTRTNNVDHYTITSRFPHPMTLVLHHSDKIVTRPPATVWHFSVASSFTTSFWNRSADQVVHVTRIGLPPSGTQTPIDLAKYFNDSVTNIFKPRYLSPRPATPTLQIPTQGLGNWCYPLTTANIDDAGLRAAGAIKLDNNVNLITPKKGRNIVFTSRWDNFPDSITIPLTGQASKATFLVAGTTNPMQSQIMNGLVTIYYTDGTTDDLQLINPSNWWPIEEDYLDDGLAFTTGAPHPTRISLKTGEKLTNPKYTTIKGLTNMAIDGGAATILDMPLDPNKQLDHLILKATARDVLIGLMAITLQKTK